MTRWLVAPLLCALTIPQTAWAQQPSPPATEAAPTEVAAPAQAPEGPAEAPTTEAAETPTAELPATTPAEPEFTPAPAPPAPTLATAPAPPKPTGPELDKRAEPLLATGLGGFFGVYALTAYVGAATIDKARDIGRSDWDEGSGNLTRNRGRSLLIPVAGPFIAMHFTNSARRKYWQAVNGSLQAGTLVMAILGARMYRKHNKAKRRAQLTASASPEGAQLGMAMRF